MFKRLFFGISAFILISARIFSQEEIENMDRFLHASTPYRATYKIHAFHEGSSFVDANGIVNEESSVGSGTAIHPQYVLTAAHVLIEQGKKIKKIEISKPEYGKAYKWPARLVDVTFEGNGGLDIALLKVEDPYLLDFVPLAEAQLSTGNVIGLSGYGLNMDTPNIRGVRLVKSSNSVYVGDSYADNGDSGGGMFTEDGRLTGIIWGSNQYVHGVPLKAIISWLRIRQAIPGPNGTFQYQTYRHFQLGGRQIRPPYMQLGNPPNQAQQGWRPHQQGGSSGNTAPPFQPQNQNGTQQQKSFEIIPLRQYIQYTQCGSSSCSTGYGGGYSYQPYYGQPSVVYRQPPQGNMTPRAGGTVKYDGNVSPYKPGGSVEPSYKAPVADREPEKQKGRYCECQEETVLEAIKKVACNCEKNRSSTASQEDRSVNNSKKSDCEDSLKEIRELIKSIKKDHKETSMEIAEISKDVKSLGERVSGLEGNNDVSTGNNESKNEPTPAKPEPSNTTDSGKRDKPCPPCNDRQIIYLTAVNMPGCESTDDVVHRKIQAGFNIRIIKLRSNEVKVGDVPRIAVFPSGDQFFGESNVKGYLAQLVR